MGGVGLVSAAAIAAELRQVLPDLDIEADGETLRITPHAIYRLLDVADRSSGDARTLLARTLLVVVAELLPVRPGYEGASRRRREEARRP